DRILDSAPSWARTLAPIVLVLALAVPYLLARRAQRALLKGDLRRGQIYQTLTENSGWISFGLLLFVGGWIEAVRGWTGAALDLDGWPEGALGLSFLPFIAYQIAAIDASVREGGGTRGTRRHLRAFRCRMFFACLAPILVFITASVVLGRNEWLRVQVEHVGLASVLFTGLMVLVLAQLLPWLLRWSWDTVPFPDGPQRDRLNEVAKAASFEPRDIRLWRTGDLMANAAIVGFTPRGRTVLFSDQLLSILNTRELCAVYGHEIGHARRGHVTVFLCWTLGFVFLGDYAARVALDVWGGWVGGGVALAMLGLWFVSFGWLSRRFELDADLFSLETVEDLPALVSALERVGGRDREASGWRHFGVARRIRFLARTVSNEAFVARFRRRLRRLSIVGALLAITGACAQLFDLVQSLPRDRAVASLARGKFSQATTLAADLDGEDAQEIRELAEAASRIGSGSREAVQAALDAALQSAIEGGDPKAARDLAVVAALRGVPHASALASGLTDALDGGLKDLPVGLRDAAEAWRSRR
ncbi:MAG: Zn-dependent protease with chaperone function, partial [Planctomycetota bacterium]